MAFWTICRTPRPSSLAGWGFAVRSIVAAVSLLACLGCMSQRDLSSYSEGAAPEASLVLTPEERPANPAVSSGMSPEAAPAALDEATPTPMDTAAGGERGPADAPLDPTPMNAVDPAAPQAAAEPASSDVEPTATPGADAADSCTAMGGFSISEMASCYMLGDNVFTWQDARNFCQAWGGDLVEIGTLEEDVALAQRIDGSVWIGANDQEEEGTFRWAGGAPLEYAGWAENQPNNLQGNEDCSELRAFDDHWSDVACTGDVARQALCERP